jgi:hypothetical protein
MASGFWQSLALQNGFDTDKSHKFRGSQRRTAGVIPRTVKFVTFPPPAAADETDDTALSETRDVAEANARVTKQLSDDNCCALEGTDPIIQLPPVSCQGPIRLPFVCFQIEHRDCEALEVRQAPSSGSDCQHGSVLGMLSADNYRHDSPNSDPGNFHVEHLWNAGADTRSGPTAKKLRALEGLTDSRYPIRETNG